MNKAQQLRGCSMNRASALDKMDRRLWQTKVGEWEEEEGMCDNGHKGSSEGGLCTR